MSDMFLTQVIEEFYQKSGFIVPQNQLLLFYNICSNKFHQKVVHCTISKLFVKRIQKMSQANNNTSSSNTRNSKGPPTKQKTSSKDPHSHHQHPPTRTILRTLSGERFIPPGHIELGSDDFTPKLGEEAGGAEGAAGTVGQGRQSRNTVILQTESDSNIDCYPSPSGAGGGGIQSMGQASIKSKFEYPTGFQQFSNPDSTSKQAETQQVPSVTSNNQPQSTNSNQRTPYSRMVVNLSFQSYLPTNPISNLSGMVAGTRNTHQKKIKEINDKKRKQIQKARNLKDNSYNSTKRVMGDFVIEDFQDKQLDEGLQMPLILEAGDDQPTAQCKQTTGDGLQQPKPKEKLLLFQNVDNSDEDDEPDEGEDENGGSQYSHLSTSNMDHAISQQAQIHDTSATKNFSQVNSCIYGEVKPCTETLTQQEKFPLVHLRNQRMQQNNTNVRAASPKKFEIEFKESKMSSSQSCNDGDKEVLQEQQPATNLKQETQSDTAAKDEALDDQEKSQSFKIKKSHQKVQHFIQVQKEDESSSHRNNNSGNSRDYDQNFDFLNQQELDSLHRLNPHKSSRRHNQSDHSSILGSQMFNRGKNSDSDEAISHNKTISSNSHDHLKEMLKFLKIQQQGTSISIFNVIGNEHKNRLRQILRESQILPSRMLDLEENKEMILFLANQEQSDNLMKHLQDRGFQTIDNFSPPLEQLRATNSLNSMDQESILNSADKRNENTLSFLKILNNSGCADKNNSQIVMKLKNANVLIKTESVDNQNMADQKKRTNSQSNMDMFKYPYTSIRKQEIFKEAQRERIHHDSQMMYDARMEFPGSLKLSGIQNQLASADESQGLRLQSCGESSTYANHEGMTSQSVLNNKKENSFNLLKQNRDGSAAAYDEVNRILNKSADMRVSARHDSHCEDSESTENFSYIMPTTPQMAMDNSMEKQLAQLNIRSNNQPQQNQMYHGHQMHPHGPFGAYGQPMHAYHPADPNHPANLLLQQQMQQQNQQSYTHNYNHVMDYGKQQQPGNSIFNSCPYQQPMVNQMQNQQQQQQQQQQSYQGQGGSSTNPSQSTESKQTGGGLMQPFLHYYQQIAYHPPPPMPMYQQYTSFVTPPPHIQYQQALQQQQQQQQLYQQQLYQQQQNQEAGAFNHPQQDDQQQQSYFRMFNNSPSHGFNQNSSPNKGGGVPQNPGGPTSLRPNSYQNFNHFGGLSLSARRQQQKLMALKKFGQQQQVCEDRMVEEEEYEVLDQEECDGEEGEEYEEGIKGEEFGFDKECDQLSQKSEVIDQEAILNDTRIMPSLKSPRDQRLGNEQDEEEGGDVVNLDNEADTEKDQDCPFEFQTQQEKEAEAIEDQKNYKSQNSITDDRDKDDGGQAKLPSYKKKVLVGPKCNKINFERIINSQINKDTEIEKQTTLMIRNIPIKFSQADMLKLFDEKFKGQYNYFYLPKDLKTQCGQGFAFINFLDSLFILDFYLEFNCIKWSEKIEKCNSTKYCQITYANVQGIKDIKAELSDKNIMKKTEGNVRPQFFECGLTNYLQEQMEKIRERYLNDEPTIQHYRQKIKEFDEIQKKITMQKEQEKKAQEEAKIQKEKRMALLGEGNSNQKKKASKNKREQVQSSPSAAQPAQAHENVPQTSMFGQILENLSKDKSQKITKQEQQKSAAGQNIGKGDKKTSNQLQGGNLRQQSGDKRQTQISQGLGHAAQQS